MMLARNFMTTEVFTVQEHQHFNDVEISAEWRHIRHIPVIAEEDRLVGIVSVRDLLSHLSVAGASRFTPIKELMTAAVVTAAPDTPMEDLARLMLEQNISSIPIVQGGRLIGIITERDFVKLATRD